jgi:thioredoxin 1
MTATLALLLGMGRDVSCFVSLGENESSKLPFVKSRSLRRILKYASRLDVKMLSDSKLDKIHAEKTSFISEGSQQEHASQGHVVELTEGNFDKLINSGKVTFVDFWAVWCGPCRMMEPIVERLAVKFGAGVTFGKLNVDEHPAIATKYEVQSIPTFMLFKNGVPVDAVIGTMQEAVLEQRIRKSAGT